MITFDTIMLDLPGGRALPVTVRQSARARRLAIRLMTVRAELELVLPRGVTLAAGLRFLRERQDWIVQRASGLPGPLVFEDGAEVPVLGEPHRIRHRPGALFAIEESEIRVSGDPAHLGRRVRDGLKACARVELSKAVRPLAERLGRRVTHIAVRDPRTRWGSCSSTGRLGFSWRLVMAPANVLHYVAAHEVAHLAEMNHGAAFWATVERLDPSYRPAREWLRRHGADLHRYG